MAEAYKSVELQTAVPGIGYSLKHREAVKKLTVYFCKKAVEKVDGNGEIFTKRDYEIMCNRAKCHDMDKILASLSYPQLTADYFHRLFNGHHLESVIEPAEKSKYDWMEMIFDSESAKYTKPDKQGGGAYAFMSKHRTAIMCYLEPYFQLFGLNKLDTGFVKEIKDSLNHKIYEKDLDEAFLEYIHTTRIHLLDNLSRVDDKGYMQAFNRPVPMRHKATQCPGGVDHRRPNDICATSRSIMAREMINGTLEAEIFDFDSICILTADQVKVLNQQALGVIEQLKNVKAQR